MLQRVSKFFNFDMKLLQKPELFDLMVWPIYPLSLPKTYVTSLVECSTLLELCGEVWQACLCGRQSGMRKNQVRMSEFNPARMTWIKPSFAWVLNIDLDTAENTTSLEYSSSSYFITVRTWLGWLTRWERQCSAVRTWPRPRPMAELLPELPTESHTH